MTDMRKYMNLLENPNSASAEFIECLKIWIGGSTDGNDVYGLSKTDRERIQKVFDEEMPVMNESHTVWRGYCDDSHRKMSDESNFWNQNIFGVDFYISTTFDKDMARAFMRNCFKDTGGQMILFEITTLPGRRGINVNDYLPGGYTDEKELILDRNSRFKFTKYEMETDDVMVKHYTEAYENEKDMYGWDETLEDYLKLVEHDTQYVLAKVEQIA